MKDLGVDKLLREKQICQIINPRLVKTSSDTTIRQAVELMQQERSSYIVIADGGQIKGICTETDLVQRILGKTVDWDHAVSEVMTKDIKVLTPEDTVGTAIDLMGTQYFDHIPLVDKQQELVGILSVRSVIRFLAAFYPEVVYNLPPKPGQVSETAEGG